MRNKWPLFERHTEEVWESLASAYAGKWQDIQKEVEGIVEVCRSEGPKCAMKGFEGW